MTNNFLTVQDFFGSIFVDSYVFALNDKEGGGGQYKGSMPTQHCGSADEINRFFEENYFELNKKGYGIHFTPNGIKTLEEKNRKHNFSHINAWYIDIDIDGAKKIEDEGTKMHREDMKEMIRGRIFDITLWPSLTVETRNGFHLYWFAAGDAKPEHFDYIQGKILYLFKDFGGDEAACSIMHSLRVPYFRYFKNGETGQVLPFEALSTLKIHSETEMLEWLKPFPVYSGKKPARVKNRVGPELDTSYTYAINVYQNQRHGIFSRAEQRPIKEILSLLSGQPEVKGEIYSFKQTSENKYNLLANGQMTPNWIDTKDNKIFSNNSPNFCVIHHFLAWYGLDNKQIAQLYYKIGI